MEAQVASKAKSMAKRSLVFGSVSAGLLIFNLLILLYARTLPPMGLSSPALELFLASACLLMVSLIVIVTAFIAGLMAIMRNGGDNTIKLKGITGVLLSVTSIVVSWIIFTGW